MLILLTEDETKTIMKAMATENLRKTQSLADIIKGGYF